MLSFWLPSPHTHTIPWRWLTFLQDCSSILFIELACNLHNTLCSFIVSLFPTLDGLQQLASVPQELAAKSDTWACRNLGHCWIVWDQHLMLFDTLITQLQISAHVYTHSTFCMQGKICLSAKYSTFLCCFCTRFATTLAISCWWFLVVCGIV